MHPGEHENKEKRWHVHHDWGNIIKANYMYALILFVFAAIASANPLFPAPFLGAALALAAIYVVIPTEEDIMNKLEEKRLERVAELEKKFKAEGWSRKDMKDVREQKEVKVTIANDDRLINEPRRE
jgi:flagellar biosynthesis component FlhA